MKYYIYIYLDPRKPGKYIYDDYCFLYEPFYIGKGTGRRWKEIKFKRNIYFKNKVNKIKELGFETIVLKIKENIEEKESFILEINLIDIIGRKDVSKGPLVNFTNGGEGSSGRIVSNEELKKRRKNFSDIRKEFEGKNYKLLTEEKDYKNAFTKLNYMCNENHKGLISWADFKQGHGCLICFKELQSEKKKGENNSQSILTEKDVIKIWNYLNEGILFQREIGEKFGVSNITISKIKTGKTWKHLKIREVKSC